MCAKELLKLKNIKLNNTLSALNTLRDVESLSRVELAAKMHCNGTAVTRITRHLIDKGLLKSIGMAKSTGGRPREQIKLNADWKNAIGIELAPDYITGFLVNLKGEVQVREQIFLNSKRTKKVYLDSLTMLIERLLVACEKDKLLGIGVATFGSFSGANKVLENVAVYPALEKFDIAKYFRKKFSITPVITDDIHALTQYEIWFNKAHRGSFLLFEVGRGIGCATAIDGKIAFGKFSNTGEFGHTIYKYGGEKCACGRKGCLETLCSIRALEKKCRFKSGNSGLMFLDIVDDYNSGSNKFSDIVEDCACWLGIAVANQINFLVPDKIVVTGELFKLGEKFYKIFLDTIKEYSFPVFFKGVQINLSRMRDESAASGAASLLIRKVFEDFEYIDKK